jgi:hypothetical protein
MPLACNVFFHLIVIADLFVEMINRLQQRRHRPPDRLRNLAGQFGREGLRRALLEAPGECFADPAYRIDQLRSAFHQHFARPYPAQIRLRLPAPVPHRMQQPRFEIKQLR